MSVKHAICCILSRSSVGEKIPMSLIDPDIEAQGKGIILNRQPAMSPTIGAGD